MDAILANGEYIITLAAIIGAIIAIYKYINKMITWIDNQKKQDAEIEAIKKENEIHSRAILALLKGMSELGADGPVTAMIAELENYLSEKAHT